ncbi:alpha/beta hydrolase [Galactobacter caseinivorans]|uniref:Alpha/beta fold hydrolase n=1 Tax=Galactobacter caseinivorans TaxID=2676123 RepID=A0A496PKH8_9MICC|nr:alpha/beta fold hydrolase [Galactobacter caseinivorans]RKW70988.1 alpha/beta fold hydrolase [Galactobacter caseinivorans]
MPQGIHHADPRQPYFAQGSTGVAVIVQHGFTSVPGSVFPWVQAFEQAGHTVSAPMLAGHGTAWRDMIPVTYPEWTLALEAEFDRLAATHRHVVVAGISMGGALALHLAAVRRPAAVLTVNPALYPHPLALRLAGPLKRWVPSTAAVGDDISKPGVTEGAYERTPTAAAHQLARLEALVRRELPGIEAPLTLFRSDTDHVVSDASVRTLLHGLNPDARARVRRVALHRSFHVATVDHDAELIGRISVERVAEATGLGMAPAAGPAQPSGASA